MAHSSLFCQYQSRQEIPATVYQFSAEKNADKVADEFCSVGMFLVQSLHFAFELQLRLGSRYCHCSWLSIQRLTCHVLLRSLRQAVPHWSRGVFSVRFGGSEFKGPNLACTNGHARPDLSTAASTPEGGVEAANGVGPHASILQPTLLPKECLHY